MMCFSPQSNPAQTPASPANTLDPSQGLQPPTELFAPFNPASVPSGGTLFISLLKYTSATSEGGNKRSGRESVEKGDEGELQSQKLRAEERDEEKKGGLE